jgi:hypothetical protein
MLKSCLSAVFLFAACAFSAEAAGAQSNRYVVTRGEVAEELLRIVIDGNPDFTRFGINAAELKREPVVQRYAWEILQKNQVSGRQFTSDITVGSIYSLAGQLKHDICANVETTNYMDRYVRYEPTLAGWLTNVQSCLEVFGDAVLSSNGHIMARMIRGTQEDLQIKPDSYGYTIYSDDRKYEFRTLEEASRLFLNRAPARSVNLIILYGHGAPGSMSIGNDELESDRVITLLRDKLAPGAEVHLLGCNTSSVPMFVSYDIALPAKGLSYFGRRLMYYTGVRVSGASVETGEAMWNMDMARDVSAGLSGVKVCGMRTFGLVPERLVGPQRVEPGLVLGERACYLNGGGLRD